MDSAKGHRFIVIEDEMMVLLMIEDMLADLGHEVVGAAATCQQALDLIATRSFDAALLDMNLNGEKCGGIAEALVARGIPFIFCTGSDMLDVAPELRTHPMLRKPFSYEELVDKVSQLPLRAH